MEVMIILFFNQYLRMKKKLYFQSPVNLEELLFQLFILGKIEHDGGTVLTRKKSHIYTIEMPPDREVW